MNRIELLFEGRKSKYLYNVNKDMQIVSLKSIHNYEKIFFDYFFLFQMNISTCFLQLFDLFKKTFLFFVDRLICNSQKIRFFLNPV